MPLRRAGGSFVASRAWRDSAKPCSLQISRRTVARLSAKVGRCLWYQALAETRSWARLLRRDASRATTENRPSRQGVVRAMALSDHCRWVSTPRWSRTSRKVTSSCQRWTNQRTICSGSCARSLCCRVRRYGRVEPDPCFGSCDADVVRTPEVEHSVQHAGRDGHLGGLTAIRLGT